MTAIYHCYSFLFLFTHPPTTEIYTLSLHDALPIFGHRHRFSLVGHLDCLRLRVRHQLDARHHGGGGCRAERDLAGDRKSTRLNSSHVSISYAVFCLKKKNIPKDMYIYMPTLLEQLI